MPLAEAYERAFGLTYRRTDEPVRTYVRRQHYPRLEARVAELSPLAELTVSRASVAELLAATGELLLGAERLAEAEHRLRALVALAPDDVSAGALRRGAAPL